MTKMYPQFRSSYPANLPLERNQAIKLGCYNIQTSIKQPIECDPANKRERHRSG
jgi:hypothetical protein